MPYAQPYSVFHEVCPIPVYNPSRFSINVVFSGAAVTGVELK